MQKLSFSVSLGDLRAIVRNVNSVFSGKESNGDLKGILILQWSKKE